MIFKLEDQLPHEIVNLLFTITNLNIKLTFCGKIDFSKPINRYLVSDKTRAKHWRWGLKW
jgi:hypothetical protein